MLLKREIIFDGVPFPSSRNIDMKITPKAGENIITERIGNPKKSIRILDSNYIEDILDQ